MIHSVNIEAYLKLREAVLEVAYDNGCINRHHTETEVLENAFEALACEFDPSELQRVNAYLNSITDLEFTGLVAGEQNEPTTELEELVNRVLNHAFENLL